MSVDETGAASTRRFLRRGRPVTGGVEILSRRVAREVDAHRTPDEDVLFCLRGDLDHSLVALEDRLLIVKPGFHAGTTFGTLVTTVFYRDVTGIQVHTFLVTGWIEVSTPSFQGRERKRNRQPRTSDRDVYKLPNCVPIHKRALPHYRPLLDELRERIRRAAGEGTGARRDTGDGVVEQLERLSRLQADGAITAGEFEQAKALVLRAAG